MEVNLKGYESLERALKDFRKLLERTRTLELYKRHLAYTKPSVARRLQMLRAIYRQRMRRMLEEGGNA